MKWLLRSSNEQLCDCLKLVLPDNQSTSAKDLELKKLILDQNTQLKVLQQQVEQVI